MGLPNIDISFSELAVTAITRSTRGIVALILRDDTEGDTVNTYKVITDIDSEQWTATNLQYIKDAFLGSPSKVIVLRGATSDLDYTAELLVLASKTFNWLAVPGIDSSDAADVVTWIKAQRELKKTYKVVLPEIEGDHEAIVNFATNGIVVGENTYSASQYTARIAGILAGLSLSRSATYFELSEVDSITASTDPDGDIDSGKLILIAKNDAVKIARAVNSLTTTSDTKAEQFKKIKIVEGMDLIQEDIKTTFENEYVGKVVNSYDNQVMFITAVNAYLDALEGTVLDSEYDNYVAVDAEAQRTAWESIGTDTTNMSDADIKEKTYSSYVYLAGVFKFLDAMEDISMGITLV